MDELGIGWDTVGVILVQIEVSYTGDAAIDSLIETCGTCGIAFHTVRALVVRNCREGCSTDLNRFPH